MHTNQIFLTGELKYPRFYAPGDKKKDGSAAKYPFMGARLVFPNVVYHADGHEVVLAQQSVWIDISPPKLRGGNLDAGAGRNWAKAVEGGYRFVKLLDATYVNDRRTNEGRLRITFKNMEISNQRFQSAGVNLAIIGGKAHVHDAQRLTVEERYMNPFEKDKTKAWMSRYIPVQDPKGRGLSHGQDVLVFGALSSRDRQGNETLFVIAEEIL